MYRIYGIDDEEALQHLLGGTPFAEAPEEFQAQQAEPPPDIANGLVDGNVAQQLEDMASGASASNIAAMMAQVGQGYNGAGLGQQRMAQQQQANQAAMQQDMQSRGGGLLGKLVNIGLGAAMGNWIGGMFKKPAVGSGGMLGAAAKALRGG